MIVSAIIPTWFICTECGETEKVTDEFRITDGWYLQRNEDLWDVYCPCINDQTVQATLPEVDGTGYLRGKGTGTWNPSDSYYSTTTNPTVEYSFWTPLKKPTLKTARQEKLDATLAAIEDEKAEQEKRWKKWEETKHSRHMDPTCERCVEEIERIRRELKDYGKGNKEEK